MAVFTLGPKGTYSHQAAQKYFPESNVYFTDSIGEIFTTLEKEKNAFGVVAMENMIEGTIRETLDNLYETEIKIWDTLTLDIHHCICAQTENFEIITSHPIAINQCSKFLKKNFGNKAIQTTISTASACKTASEHAEFAAIASTFAAENYGLKIVRENIEDYPNNQTTFAVLHHKLNSAPLKKTFITVTPSKNEPGLLIKLLYPFYENGVNLTKIESRPQKTSMNEYIFYIEFEGDHRQAKIRKIFTYLEKDLKLCKIAILGGTV